MTRSVFEVLSCKINACGSNCLYACLPGTDLMTDEQANSHYFAIVEQVTTRDRPVCLQICCLVNGPRPQCVLLEQIFFLSCCVVGFTKFQLCMGCCQLQMTEGNLWLKDNLGVTPKNAWAIDPFGYSPTMAYLLKEMGFKNMLIQRAHYEVKKVLAEERSLEFNWRQSWDPKNKTDIFCHMMPFYSYDIPHTCGPDPAVCCQFDYWRLAGVGTAQLCPWGKNPMKITAENVRERAELLLDQYRKKSTLYRTHTLLAPLGDDFRYVTSQEAELQYDNYQLIFDYINSHPDLKAQAQFGTLEEYFEAVRAEVKETLGNAAVGSDSAAVPGFPVLSGDFFTYADREKDYWSGYYVSRPFFKAVDRVLEHTLRAAEMLFAFSQAFCQQTDVTSFPLVFGEQLLAARRNLALFQHHDGVTGTAKNHVVNDYAARMHKSINDLSQFMSSSVAALLHKGECQDRPKDFFAPEQTRTAQDVLPSKLVIDMWEQTSVRRVVVFNSLERAVEQVMTVLVTDPFVCVFDSEWRSIVSQVSPEWKGRSHGVSTGRHRLSWQAFVPAMGLQTYFVAKYSQHDCKVASLASLLVFNAPSSFSCPPPYSCSLDHSELAEIKNQHTSLFFSSSDGLLRRMKQHGGLDVMVEEEIRAYSSHGSGAYLFKPIGEAASIVRLGGIMLVTLGEVMQELYSEPRTIWDNYPLVRSARLYTGVSMQANMIEMDYHVEFMESQYNNKELVVRFNTGLKTNGVFFSDLNGFQTIKRQTYSKIPLQGNYYPMPSLAFLQCSGGRRFSIHSRQALGVASLMDGCLEVMLERRLTQDDNRGLGQGVMDNHPTNIVFNLLLETNKSVLSHAPTSYSFPSLLSHQVNAELNYPLHLFVGRREQKLSPKHVVERGALTTTFSPLSVHLPCDVHVVAMKIPRPLVSATSRQATDFEYSLTLLRRGWDTDYGVDRIFDRQCVLALDYGLTFLNMFRNFDLTDLRRSSLTLLHDEATQPGYLLQAGRKARAGVTEHRTLAPMELQAFKFGLIPSE